MKKYVPVVIFTLGLVVIGAGLFYFMPSGYPASTSAENHQAVASNSSTNKPSCTVSTNKALYRFGEEKVISWRSKFATAAFFDSSIDPFVTKTGELNVPAGAGIPPLPTGEIALQGSTSITLGSNGYNVIALTVRGPGGEAHCYASFYTSAYPQSPVHDVGNIGSYPARITFPSMGDRVSSSDHKLSLTLETRSVVKSATGTEMDGDIVLLVNDRGVDLPVYLPLHTKQSVQLSTGRIFMTLESVSPTTITLSN